MSNNQRPQNQKPVGFTTEEQLSKFIELQKLKVANEAKDLMLREKDMEHQSKYAHKLLELQSQLERERPSEHRKTITRVSVLFILFVILVMIFSGFCIFYNKEEFLYSLLKGAGYVVTTIAGYFFGRKSKPDKDNDSGFQSVQEVKD